MMESEVHEQLDELTLRTLELMQDLIHAKHQLQQVMSQGFLLMAKTRYAMNHQGLTSMQLPSAMSANVRLQSEQCLRPETEVRFNYLSMISEEEKSDEKGDVKHRRKNIEGQKESKKNEVAKKRELNPLVWFGLLTPLSLKEAQNSFQRGCDLVVEVANLQNELEGVVARKKYLVRSLRKARQDKNNQESEK